jgi:pilus assembly protein CpaD
MRSKRRLFARRRSRRAWIFFVATIAITTTMAACTSRTASWSPAQAPKTNKIDWVSHSHAVRPAGAGKGLSTVEREKLDRFAAEISLGYGHQVVIETPRRHRNRAAAALVRYFRARRLDPKVQVVADTGRPADDTVMVTIGRYVVTPPKCPDWSKPAGSDPNNRVGSNFGCATISNLGLMLADPGDLVRGRPKGPGDGVAAVWLVRKYREGKVTEPADVSATTSIGAGR